MKLADYLYLNRIKLVVFATKIGISQPSVSKLASGVNRPTLETMQLIYVATDGAVTAEDFRRQHYEEGKTP
jgi:DNA-binding transcriptional regulator YdaS (Cro superfamily)